MKSKYKHPVKTIVINETTHEQLVFISEKTGIKLSKFADIAIQEKIEKEKIRLATQS